MFIYIILTIPHPLQRKTCKRFVSPKGTDLFSANVTKRHQLMSKRHIKNTKVALPLPFSEAVQRHDDTVR